MACIVRSFEFRSFKNISIFERMVFEQTNVDLMNEK